MSSEANPLDENFALNHLLFHFHSAGEHQEINNLIERSAFLSRRIQTPGQQNKLVEELLGYAADSALSQADFPRFYQYCLRGGCFSSIGRMIVNEQLLPILLRGTSETLIWELLRQSSDKLANLQGLAWLAVNGTNEEIKENCIALLTAEVKSRESTTKELMVIASRLGPLFKTMRAECPKNLGETDSVQVLIACLEGYQRSEALIDSYFWQTAQEVWALGQAIMGLPNWIRNTRIWSQTEALAMIRVIPKSSPDYWPCMCASLSRLSIQADQYAFKFWEIHFQETPWVESLLDLTADFLARYPETIQALSSKLEPALRCALRLFLDGKDKFQTESHSQRLAEFQEIDLPEIRLRLLFAYVYHHKQELEPKRVIAILKDSIKSLRQISYNVDPQTLIYYLTLSERFLNITVAQEEWVIMCSLSVMEEEKLEQMVLSLRSEPLLKWAIEKVPVLAFRVAATDRSAFDLQNRLLSQIIFTLCRNSLSAEALESYISLLHKTQASKLRESTALMLLDLGEYDQACRAAQSITSPEWEIHHLCYQLKGTHDFATIYAASQDLTHFEDEWRMLRFLACPPLEALAQLKSNQGGIINRLVWINAILTLGIHHLCEQEPQVWDEELRIELAQLDPIQLVPEDENQAAYVLPRLAFFLALIKPSHVELEFDQVFIDIFSRPKSEREALLLVAVSYLFRFSTWRSNRGGKAIKANSVVRRLVQLSRKAKPLDGEYFPSEVLSSLLMKQWTELDMEERENTHGERSPNSKLKTLITKLEILAKGINSTIHPREWPLLDELRIRCKAFQKNDPEIFKRLTRQCLKFLQNTPSALQRTLLIWQHLLFTCCVGPCLCQEPLDKCATQIRTVTKLPGQLKIETQVVTQVPTMSHDQAIKSVNNWSTTRYDFFARAWPDETTFFSVTSAVMVFLYLFLEPSYAALIQKPSWILHAVKPAHFPGWVSASLICLTLLVNFSVTWFVYNIRRVPNRGIKARWIPILLLLSVLPYTPLLVFYVFALKDKTFLYKDCELSVRKIKLHGWFLGALKYNKAFVLFNLLAFAPVAFFWPGIVWFWQHPEVLGSLGQIIVMSLFQGILILFLVANLYTKWPALSLAQKSVSKLGLAFCFAPSLPIILAGAVLIHWTIRMPIVGLNRVKEQYERPGRSLSWLNFERVVSEFKKNNPCASLTLTMMALKIPTQKQTITQENTDLTLSIKLVTLGTESLIVMHILFKSHQYHCLMVFAFLLVLSCFGLCGAIYNLINRQFGRDKDAYYKGIFWADCVLRVACWAWIGSIGGILALTPDALIYMEMVVILFGFSMVLLVLPFLIKSGKGDALLLVLVGALLILYGYTGVHPAQLEPGLLVVVMGLLWGAGIVGRNHWIQPFTWATLPGGVWGRCLWVLTLLPLGGVWLPVWAYLRHGPWLKAKEVLYQQAQEVCG